MRRRRWVCIALALITTGHLTGDVKNDGLPMGSSPAARWRSAWACLGGWRVIRTLGKGLSRSNRRRPGRRSLIGCDHSQFERCRHGVVHHPRRHRLDPGQWGRQARRPGSVDGGRTMAVAWLVTAAGGGIGRPPISYCVLFDPKDLTGSAVGR